MFPPNMSCDGRVPGQPPAHPPRLTLHELDPNAVVMGVQVPGWRCTVCHQVHWIPGDSVRAFIDGLNGAVAQG